MEWNDGMVVGDTLVLRFKNVDTPNNNNENATACSRSPSNCNSGRPCLPLLYNCERVRGALPTSAIEGPDLSIEIGARIKRNRIRQCRRCSDRDRAVLVVADLGHLYTGLDVGLSRENEGGGSVLLMLLAREY